MEYKLRGYQQEGVNLGVEFFNKKNKPAILVYSMGAGKSLILAGIAKILHSKGINTLVLQPRKELIKSNIKKYNAVAEIPATAYSASMGSKVISPVTYGTVGSMYKVKGIMANFGAVIIDECDEVNPTGMYTKLFAGYKGNILGLTATPIKLKQVSDRFNKFNSWSEIKFITRIRPKFWSKILHVTQIKDLYKSMYLTPLHYEILKKPDVKLKLNTIGSNYTEKSIIAYEKASLDVIVAKINSLLDPTNLNSGAYNKCMVFVKSIEVGVEIVNLLQEVEEIDGKMVVVKENAVIVHSKLKIKERDLAIERYQTGECPVIVNVGILTVGFDDPETDSIVLARNTMSLRLYMQILGRGTRLHPNKHHCKVVTTEENFNKFGPIEEITYEEVDGKWEVLSHGEVITNTRLDEIGKLPEVKEVKRKKSKIRMKFGKYGPEGKEGKGKGLYLHKLPIDYVEYIITMLKKSVKEGKYVKSNKELIKNLKKTIK